MTSYENPPKFENVSCTASHNMLKNLKIQLMITCHHKLDLEVCEHVV